MSRVTGKVLAFPALRNIPPPDMPLKDQGNQKYMEIAGRLLDAGKLNFYTRQLCEQIALLHHQIYQKTKSHGFPSRAALEQSNKLMRELQLVDESDSVAPETDGSENRFRRYGIVTRTWA